MGIVAVQTRASFQPMDTDKAMPATKVVDMTRIVPNVTPLILASWVAPVDKELVRAPSRKLSFVEHANVLVNNRPECKISGAVNESLRAVCKANALA